MSEKFAILAAPQVITIFFNFDDAFSMRRFHFARFAKRDWRQLQLALLRIYEIVF